MKLYKYPVLLMIVSSLYAMPNIDGTSGAIRSISADIGFAGTFDLGAYYRLFREARFADPLDDSFSIVHAGTNARYSGYDIGFYVGYAFTDWFALNASGIFYKDVIDYIFYWDETYGNQIISRSSNGLGDTKFGIKIGLGSSNLKYGLYGFFSFPTGDDRSAAIRTSNYTDYTNEGGLFRYFSSDGLDKGLIGLFTIKSGVVNLDLNLGYADRNNEEDAAGYRNNCTFYNGAVSFGSGRIVPFIEFSDIDFGGKDEMFGFADDSVFGQNQVYLTPGLNYKPGNFNVKLALDIRVLEGENTRAFPTALTDSFNITTGWGVAPPWALFLGFSYATDFVPEKPKYGEIYGTVTEAETNRPIEANVGIYLDNVLVASQATEFDGSFVFKQLEPGAYDLNVAAIEYELYEAGLLVKAGEKTPISIVLQPIPKDGMLILHIMDLETKAPMTANVTIGEMATEVAEAQITKTLKADSYVVKAVAIDENYIPYERIVNVEAGKTLELEIGLVKKEFKLVLPQVYFETDKSEIKPESYPILDDAVKTINQVLASSPDIKIEIQGHTDSIGDAAYNLTLSQNRAASVLDYLVTEHGVAASRFIAKGYGESQPSGSNETREGRAKNRRVEFVIIQ